METSKYKNESYSILNWGLYHDWKVVKKQKINQQKNHLVKLILQKNDLVQFNT